MKRFLFFILLIGVLPISGFSQDKKQVAILEPVAMTKEVSTMHRSMVRGEMVKAISNQSGYAAFTRTDIDQIMKEQNFQQSGMVDDATRKRLGAMQGVDYVCITKITREGNSFYLEANLVNIESGQISNPATQYGELDGGSLSNMLAACEKLAGELVGRKVQYTSSYSRSSYSYSSSPKLSSDEEFSSTTGSSPKASSSSSTPQSYASAQVSSCDSRVDVSIVSCLRKGSDVVFTYQLTNEGMGPVGHLRMFLPNKCNLAGVQQSVIFDNLGNEYNDVEFRYRNNASFNVSYGIAGAFPEDLPCKGTITVYDVPTNVTTLTFKLAFTIFPFTNNNRLRKNQIEFKNVPVY